MSDRFERSLEALAAESVAAEAALRAATSSDGFGRPTRCPAVGRPRARRTHASATWTASLTYLAAPAPAESRHRCHLVLHELRPRPTRPAWRRVRWRPRRFASTGDLVRGLGETWQRCVEVAARGGTRGGSLRTRSGATVRLDDYLDTRVLELAVHGLDLADALGRDPWITPARGAIVRGHPDLAAGEAPPRAGWDDVDVHRQGHRAARPHERRAIVCLGSRPDRFPLLA